MSKNKLLRIEQASIKDLFRSVDKITIPMFQREFKWSSEITELFVNSIIELVNNEEKNLLEKENYFGNFLIQDKSNNDKREITIIDGQQRLTILYLIFEEVLNLSKELSQKLLDTPRDVLRNIRTLTLYLHEVNDQNINNEKFYFENTTHMENFLARNNSKNRYFSTKKLIRANINDFLTQNETDDNDKLSLLQDLIELLLSDRLVIGIIDIFNEDVAIDIFEKMNSGKVDLTEWELLKSYYIRYMNNNKKVSKENIVKLNELYFEKFYELQFIKQQKQNDKTDKDFFEILEFFIKGKIDSKKYKYLNIRKIYEDNKNDRTIENDLNSFYDKLNDFYSYNLKRKDYKEIFNMMIDFDLKTIKKYSFGLLIYFSNLIEKNENINNFILKMFNDLTYMVTFSIVVLNNRANKYELKIKDIFGKAYQYINNETNFINEDDKLFLLNNLIDEFKDNFIKEYNEAMRDQNVVKISTDFFKIEYFFEKNNESKFAKWGKEVTDNIIEKIIELKKEEDLKIKSNFSSSENLEIYV